MNKPKIDKKTLKYGTASVILAVVFIALIFVANLVVTTLTDKYNLFVDLTEEQLYEISEASEELLKDMGDGEIKFIFLTPLDELDANEYSKSIKTLALEYEEKYDNISIEYLDMLKNPGTVAKYRQSYDISSTTVIVESDKRHVAFDMSECFVYNQDSNGNYTYYAFNAEYRFTSAIIRVMRDTMPKALFTSNHLETIPQQFKSLLLDAGFEVELIDLAQSEIPEDAELIIVNAPRTDFTGIESETEGVSEVTKLSRYLENGGNAMLFVSPDTPELKNLDELCASWGIKVNHGLAVVDNRNSVASIDSFALITRYVESDRLSAFHKSLSSAENPQKTISYYTAPITLLPVTNVSQGVDTILASYATSYIPMNDTENYAEGTVPLLVAGYMDRFDSERSETVTNYFVVGGSTWFTSDTFLGTYQNTYGNAELIKSVISEMTDETMILNVGYKVYNDTTLTIDNATSQKWLMALIFALPALVLITALGVFLKRRHL
ncbi:MAG: GldG family protein [Clostridia bacterium]|nr:GldG family protein [Clostridia bacterium]